MDFEPSARSVELFERLRAFIDEQVVPAQSAYDAELAASPGAQPAVMEQLRAAAEAEGLWNLCVRHADYGPGLSFVDAANIATTAELQGDTWVLNGRKWFISGVLHPLCGFMMTVANTDPEAGPHAADRRRTRRSPLDGDRPPRTPPPQPSNLTRTP